MFSTRLCQSFAAILFRSEAEIFSSIAVAPISMETEVPPELKNGSGRPVVGEDLGWVGCVVILALFMAFVFFGLRVAIRCRDRFGSLLAGGIAAMIGVQTVLNVAVVIGLMPTTGLPLPFFSSGGTSVSILMGATAILLNISASERNNIAVND